MRRSPTGSSAPTPPQRRWPPTTTRWARTGRACGRGAHRGLALAGEDDVPPSGRRLGPDPGLLPEGSARRALRPCSSSSTWTTISAVQRTHSFGTRTGEVTVRAERLDPARQVAAAAAPREDPDGADDGTATFGGLQDPELRYRQRYVDLAVHPGGARGLPAARARPSAGSAASSTRAAFSRSRRR